MLCIFKGQKYQKTYNQSFFIKFLRIIKTIFGICLQAQLAIQNATARTEALEIFSEKCSIGNIKVAGDLLVCKQVMYRDICVGIGLPCRHVLKMQFWKCRKSRSLWYVFQSVQCIRIQKVQNVNVEKSITSRILTTITLFFLCADT